MELLVERVNKTSTKTLGKMYIDGEYQCDTLEPVDIDLTQEMSAYDIKKAKKQNRVAIPRGTYNVSLDVVSPRFSNVPFYKEVCDGKLPRLLDVPGFTGILIHCGNYYKDTAGCILVGSVVEDKYFVDSKTAFKALYAKIKDAKELTITIK